MRFSIRILLPILMLVLSACDSTVHRFRHTVYAPSETGLTLIYENPAIADSGKRSQNRLQVRVASTEDTEEARLVRLTYTTLQGQTESLYRSKDGGWDYLAEDKRHFMILPEGFPDRVSRWEGLGAHNHVLARAAVNLPDLKLPPDSDRIGVWVESESPTGSKRRTFYLPNIGEAETQVLKDGQWVSINRLVSRGFTEVPEVKSKQ